MSRRKPKTNWKRIDPTLSDVNDSMKEKGITPVNDSKKEKGIPTMLYSKVVKGVPQNDDKKLQVSQLICETNHQSSWDVKCSTRGVPALMSGDLAKEPYNGDEELNYCRLFLLVHDIVAQALRNLYKDLLGETSFSDAIKRNSMIIDNLFAVGVLKRPQRDIIYPQNGRPDLNRLDITLSTLLLKNKIGFSNDIGDYMTSVETIQTIRNELSHSPNTTLSQQEYTNKISSLRQSLRILGTEDKDIDERLHRPIGLEEIMKVFDEYKKDVHQLRLDISDLQIAMEKQSIAFIRNNPESFLQKRHECHVKGNEFVVEVSYYGKIVKTHHIEHVDGGSSVQLLYSPDQQLPTDSPIPIIQMPDPEQANLGVTTDTMKIPIDIIYKACIEFKDGITIKNEDGCFSAKRLCKINPFCVSFSTQQPQQILNNGEWQNIFTYNEDELDPTWKKNAYATVVIFLGKEREYKDYYKPNIPVTIRMTQCKALEEFIVPPYSGTHGLDISDEETHMQEDQANIEATPGVIAM